MVDRLDRINKYSIQVPVGVNRNRMQTIILGDCNLRSVNWETMVGDASGITFIEFSG